MNNEWKVQVEYRPGKMSMFIYVSRRIAPNQIEFITKGGDLREVVETTGAFNDEVYYARLEDDSISSLLVEALDKRGIKAPSQSFTEGKMQATEAHLSDLRKMIPKLSDKKDKGVA